MGPILSEGGTVVTVDDAGQVFDPGYLLVEGDRIAALGPGWAHAALRAGADTIMDAACMAVIPTSSRPSSGQIQTIPRNHYLIDS